MGHVIVDAPLGDRESERTPGPTLLLAWSKVGRVLQHIRYEYQVENITSASTLESRYGKMPEQCAGQSSRPTQKITTTSCTGDLIDE